MRKLLLLLTALVLAVTFLMAAGERAAISGTVSDKTGAVIPGVTIRVVNTATNQTTRASARARVRRRPIAPAERTAATPRAVRPPGSWDA